jgi:putative long chain acyl-CoA synthase
VRLFFGSGMPSGLWERVERRFAPARVLEFYAATEADVILANLSGHKWGSLGRPMPGSAATRLAAWDVVADQLARGSDGLGIGVAPGEAGMPLAAIAAPRFESRILRGVFESGDAWLPTGDLFRCDQDGDLWLVDNAATTVRCERGPVFVRAITDVLARQPGVDLAFTYALEQPAGEVVAVTAVTCSTITGSTAMASAGRWAHYRPPSGRTTSEWSSRCR